MNLWQRFLDIFSLRQDKEVIEIVKENELLRNENKKLLSTNELLELNLQEDVKLIGELDEELRILKFEDPKETYWNTKRAVNNSYTYQARPAINTEGNIKVDPKIFFTLDNSIPIVKGKDNDEKAFAALKWVIDNYDYESDTAQFKDPEVWLFAFEALDLKHGDCEDGAILLANIMIKSGIPYWRVRLNTGDVEGGGHCWVTYLRESDNQWLIMDWCYWPNDSLKGITWKEAEKYFDIWFSFNQKFIFVDDDLDRP